MQNSLDKFKQSVKALYGDNLDKILLFGSQARGEAHSDSDIDILVVLKKMNDYSQEIEKTSISTAQICLDNNVVISRSFTTLEEFQKNYSPFFLNIKREGIVL